MFVPTLPYILYYFWYFLHKKYIHMYIKEGAKMIFALAVKISSCGPIPFAGQLQVLTKYIQALLQNKIHYR